MAAIRGARFLALDTVGLLLVAVWTLLGGLFALVGLLLVWSYPGRPRPFVGLLYLHGGMPDYFLSQRFPTGLEDHFTVVWWEQRGSGLSYSPSTPPETLTVEQFIDDTLALTNYLRSRFGQEKIYLMGHSGRNLLRYPSRRQGAASLRRLHWRGAGFQPT